MRSNATIRHALRRISEARVRLAVAIGQERGRPLPDFLRISTLKKERLHLKDRQARLGRLLNAAG